ncbi:MAG: hypothetical protein WC150_02450 [Bacteroidia bacterium]
MEKTWEDIFLEEVMQYLQSVSKENFHQKYEELQSIVDRYILSGIDPHEINKVLATVDDKMEVGQFQFDVIYEISQRIFKWYPK